MVTLMAPGDQAILSPFNMEYMQLCRSSLTLPPKCIVLSVGQDFFNGSPTAVLRIATSNVLDMTGSSNPVLCLSPITARECQLVDEYGFGFVSPLAAIGYPDAPVAGACSATRAGVAGMGGGVPLAADAAFSPQLMAPPVQNDGWGGSANCQSMAPLSQQHNISQDSFHFQNPYIGVDEVHARLNAAAASRVAGAPSHAQWPSLLPQLPQPAITCEGVQHSPGGHAASHGEPQRGAGAPLSSPQFAQQQLAQMRHDASAAAQVESGRCSVPLLASAQQHQLQQQLQHNHMQQLQHQQPHYRSHMRQPQLGQQQPQQQLQQPAAVLQQQLQQQPRRPAPGQERNCRQRVDAFGLASTVNNTVNANTTTTGASAGPPVGSPASFAAAGRVAGRPVLATSAGARARSPSPVVAPPLQPPLHSACQRGAPATVAGEPTYVTSMLANVVDPQLRYSVLLAAANMVLPSAAVVSCNGADGIPAYTLLFKAVGEALEGVAAQHTPPPPTHIMLPKLDDGTPYQQAMCSLQRFIHAFSAPPGGHALLQPPPPPPLLQQPTAMPIMQQPQQLTMQPPPHSKPSRPTSGVPAEAKTTAVHTALLLDRVAANHQDVLALEGLSHMLRSHGPNNSEFQEALHNTTLNVKALLGLDVEHVDPGSGERVQESYLYARVLVKARSAEVRNVLRDRERLLVPLHVEPAPDFEKFCRYIQSGALLLISEEIVAKQPGSSKSVLFAGGFSESDKARAYLRIEVVLRAFAVAHPPQKDLVRKALSTFENLLRECMETRIEMKTFHASVWEPFARATQRAYSDAREQIDTPLPDLDISKISEDSPLIRALFRRAAFAQQTKPVLLPPQVVTPPTAASVPLVAAGPNALVRPTLLSGAPRPPAGASPTFNPAFPNQPGFVALPNPKPPHNPLVPGTPCRGWEMGKCMYGVACRFKHAGY